MVETHPRFPITLGLHLSAESWRLTADRGFFAAALAGKTEAGLEAGTPGKGEVELVGGEESSRNLTPPPFSMSVGY